jgi:hypothetical protein
MGHPSNNLQKLLKDKSKRDLIRLHEEICEQPGITSTKLNFLVMIRQAIKTAKH